MGSGLDPHGRRKDGSEFPVEISLSPLQTEDGVLLSSAIRDITERKRMEVALASAHQELEAFSHAVAHDLRSPIRRMSGFARILREVCWDVKVTCGDGQKLSANTCQDIGGEGKASSVVPNGKFSGGKCTVAKVAGIAVENVHITAK